MMRVLMGILIGLVIATSIFYGFRLSGSGIFDETCFDGKAVVTHGQVKTKVIIGERRLCGRDMQISNLVGPTIDAMPDHWELEFHMFVVE